MTADTRKRCLVADDDANIRELVAMNLEAEGLEVYTAENGDAARLMAEELVPDLIVLDVMMPGSDGYQVLSHLKACERTREVPVVLLTAKATDAEIWEGWKSGADYYITKPFSVDQLVHFVHLVFEESGAPS